ncbi:MAG: hypothetical protein L6461_18285 [Anaerolineae bacterium]|nr:hypothetical protein [Anaerolineae bacterium]
MKKKILPLALGLVLFFTLGIIALLAGLQRPVSASVSEPLAETVVLPTVIVPTIAPDKVEEADKLLQEIQSQIEEANKKYLKDGWLHIVYQTKNSVASDGTIGNGISIPQEYTMDDWYFLEDDGAMKTSAVSFMRDTAGNIVQYSVLYKGKWHNKTINDITDASPFAPKIDFGFANRAAEMSQSISKQELKTENLVSYTLPIQLAAPIQLAGYDQPTQGTVEKAYFHADGSGLFKLETYMILPDGNQVLDSVTTMLILENLEKPSEEIVKILEEVQQ